MRDEHGQPRGFDGRIAGQRSLSREGEIDFAGFQFESAEKRGRVGEVEQGKLLDADGAFGGIGDELVGVVGGLQGAQDGRSVLWAATGGHGVWVLFGVGFWKSGAMAIFLVPKLHLGMHLSG